MTRLSDNPVRRGAMSGYGFTQVYAWGAAPFMKKALLLNGNVGIVFEGANGTTKILTHNVMQRPLKQLPWPLSLAQPHSVSYSLVGPDHNTLTHQEFSRSEIDEAIQLFLSGLGENDIISISVK